MDPAQVKYMTDKIPMKRLGRERGEGEREREEREKKREREKREVLAAEKITSMRKLFFFFACSFFQPIFPHAPIFFILPFSHCHLSFSLSLSLILRCGTIEEVAATACWIVSSEASFNTGFCFDLTGGRAVY